MALTTNDVSSIHVQVKNWRDEGSLSTPKIDDIFQKMESFAEKLVPGARYITMLMSVSEGAIRKEECDHCAYDGRKPQPVPLRTSLHHTYPTPRMATALRQIADWRSRQDEIVAENYRCVPPNMNPARIIEMHGGMQPVSLTVVSLAPPSLSKGARPAGKKLTFSVAVTSVPKGGRQRAP